VQQVAFEQILKMRMFSQRD